MPTDFLEHLQSRQHIWLVMQVELNSEQKHSKLI